MGLLDFLFKADPNKVANEIFMYATTINISSNEINILSTNDIEINTYKTERLMMQLSVAACLTNYLSKEGSNKFFKDVGRILNSKIEIYIKERNYFYFEDGYAVDRHMTEYYLLNSSQHLLTMLFHAMRRETLIRKNETIHTIFLKSIDNYLTGFRKIVAPYRNIQ
jgi:hypothetical protein